MSDTLAPIGQHETFGIFTQADDGLIVTFRQSDGTIAEGHVVNVAPVEDLAAVLTEHRDAINALRRERQEIDGKR